ncbi:MAG: hypothetical protein ACLRMW_13545 [[Clostridium] symbiosum]
MGKKSVRTALFLLPAAFCLLILFFRPHSLNQVRPVTGGDKADGVFCALETEAGKQEGDDRRFLPAAQPVSFSVKAGYKNGLYIKEEEPDLDSLQPPEGGDCPVFFTIPFSDSFAGLKGSFCLHLCTALLQMGSALYLVCILHKRDGKKRVTA